MNQQNTTYTVDEAQKKLEHYCAYQERCHQEVVHKLQQMGMIPLAIDSIITHLITQNYLNEGRYATAFVSGKFRIKKWGKIRIKRELKSKGVSELNIKQALKTISLEEYLETFNALAEKKFDSINEQNKYKKKKKLIDYLQYRGWESNLIFEKVNDLLDS